MLNYRTLVLNADFIPLKIIPLSAVSWQEAFRLIYTDKAVPISYHEAYARTVKNTYRIPSVIVLKEYKYFKKFAKWSKDNVKIRDKFTCQYCNKRFSKKSLTVDHVVPKSIGGRHSWTNSVAACKKCNQTKMDKRILPKVAPIRPTYMQLVRNYIKLEGIPNPEWSKYVEFLEK